MSLNGRPHISSSVPAAASDTTEAAAGGAASFGVAYILCQLTGWGVWALFGAVLSSRATGYSFGRAFVSYALYSGYGLLTSHLLRHTIKRNNWLQLSFGKYLPRMIAVAALCVLAMTASLYFINIRLLHLFDPGAFTAPFLAMVAVNTSVVYGFWMTIYISVQISRRRRQAELINLRMELALRDAQYRSLSAQVNPHFLFNSLNSLRALILVDPQKAITAVTHLAGVLRYSLAADSSTAHAQGNERVVPLQRELQAVDDYLALERIRFENRLRVTQQIDPACLHAPIPRMMLQHLVENAVKHGIAPSYEGGELHIAARILADYKPGRLQIMVRNPGQTALSTCGTKTGLTNTRQRLALLYGLASGASCTLEEHNGTVTATLVLPLEAGDSSSHDRDVMEVVGARPSGR